MAKLFSRHIEDFVCERCGAEVRGDGYTNHCPRCLWSKHVDIDPGDRAATCGGMMEPFDLRFERARYWLHLRCVACGHERRNRTSDGDDLDAFLSP